MTAPSPETGTYVHPDEARMAAFRRVYEDHRLVEDIYPRLARRFEAEGIGRFLELGGGRGPISTILAGAGVSTAVVDLDPQMLAEAHRPAVRADISHLPVADASVDGAAAVNCLYFLDDPRTALVEAYRVMRPGGLLVASSPSRYNDPELEGIDPAWGTATTFDSEDAPRLVEEIFGAVEVQPWELVGYVLPDSAAVADYLHAFNVPDWQEKARAIRPPMNITKRGAQVWARR